MTTATQADAGYAAASFELPTESGFYRRFLELQVSPVGFKLRFDRGGRGPTDWRASWVGADAVAAGMAVALGHMPPAVLGDWCDENTPATIERDTNTGGYDWPGRLLRKAV